MYINGFPRETDLKGKVLFKRDLFSKMRMRLESGGERAVLDNRYIAVFKISNVRLSRFCLDLMRRFSPL